MGAGRKTKYNKKIVDKICELTESDTYTIKEICEIVRIHKSTYFEWLDTKPEFSDRIKKAQAARTEFFVAEAKKSLLKKIQGYSVPETSTTTVGTGRYDANGREIARVKERKVTDKFFQPDTAAIIFTLCNGEPDRWKNRQATELTGKEGKDLFAKLSDEELDDKIKDLQKKVTE